MNPTRAVPGRARSPIACGAWLALALVLGATSAAPARAESSQEELAKLARNPIANPVSAPLQNNANFGVGPLSGTQNILDIQPVVPIGVNRDWIVFSK